VTDLRISPFRRRPPPCSTLFPYTTLFRSRPSSTSPANRCRNGSGAAAHAQTDKSAPRPACPRTPPTYAHSSDGPCNKGSPNATRSEEHTSELQSRFDLVCRLLLEKKNTTR